MKFKQKHKKEIKRLNKEGNNYSEIADKIMTTFFDDFDKYSHRTIRGEVSNELHIVAKTVHPHFGTHLVTGCNHAPFDNKHMTNGMIELMKDLGDKLAGIHLIGDFLDLNSLSSHDRGQKPLPGITLSSEYEGGNRILDRFDAALPVKCIKNYMYGNHEDRYLRYMSSSDHSKLGSSLISPEEGLNLSARGYNVFTNWKKDKIKLGNHLDLIHGEFCNIHTAKKHLDSFRGSIMFVHTHRIQTHIESKVGGFNIGFGADKDSPVFNYATRAMKEVWANGFALVTIDEDGFFHVNQITMFNDCFYYNGKKYN
jgi:hypothetical protein